MQPDASASYAAASRAVGTAREQEFDVFRRSVIALTRGRADPGNPAALVRALHDNRRLWTHLACDVSGPDNLLPEATRVQILSLAGFVLAHTGKILGGSADIDVLVEINTAMMRGLRDTAAPGAAGPRRMA